MTASTEQRLTRLELDAYQTRHSIRELRSELAHLASSTGSADQRLAALEAAEFRAQALAEKLPA